MPEFLENTIAALSPAWSLKRKLARELLNSYRGGMPTRDSELWQTPSGGFKYGTAFERNQLANGRDRGMQAFDNNPVAQSIVQIEADNVVGDGLNYTPGTDSEEWNREAVDKYYEWLEGASVRGTDFESGCELQKYLWENSRAAGDIGWILVNRDYDDNGTILIDSRIQIITADKIVTPDKMWGDKDVIDGIRMDEFGRPQVYYVLYQDEQGTRNFTPISARDFVFLPHTRKPNQVRGTTCYMTIFDLLSHLDRYVDGVSLAAWMATVIGLIFKQNNSAKQYSGLATAMNSEGNQQKAITLENGMLKMVGTGDDVVQVNAHQPMQQTPEFIRAMFRMLGQPFQMPLEVLAMDMSTCTFASARIGLLPFYRSCRIKAARFGSRWSRTIRWWLSREKLRADSDPKKWKTAFPENYWAHELLVNAWDYTDPVSEAQSDLLQIDMGTKSLQMVMAERGRDAQKINRENEEQRPEIHSTLTRDETPTPAAPAPPDKNPPDAVKAYARARADLLEELSESNGDNHE